MAYSVAIDTPPGGEYPRERAALIAACSEIVAPEVCREETGERADAKVSWTAAGRAEMRVLYRGTAHFRVLTFDAVDTPVERWRAAGLVTGSLLQSGEAPAGGVAPLPRSQQASLPVSAPSRHGRPRTSSVHMDLSATAAVGAGLSDGSLRWGGWLGVQLAMAGFLWAGAALRSMVEPTGVAPSTSGRQELGANWWWAGGMVGAWWEPGMHVTLRPGVGLGREWLNVQVDANEVSAAEGAQRSYVSVWVGMVSALSIAPALDLLVGIAATTTPGQKVTIAGRPVGSNRDSSPELTLGASYRLF